MSFNPQPSYHLCPSFGYPPPPEGHLDLGIILKSLDRAGVGFPVNRYCQINIPEDERYPRNGTDEKLGFTRTLKELRTTKASIWAKILSLGGAQFNFLRDRSDDETLTVERLHTRYFIPSKEYMEKTLEQSHVVSYLNDTSKRGPLYMVTGYMYVEGANITKAKNKHGSLIGEAAVTEQASNVSAGAGAGYNRNGSSTVGFLGSTPFILGLRVRKIWWNRNGSRQTSDNVAGAVLGSFGSSHGSILDEMEYEDDWVPGENDGQVLFENDLEKSGLENSVWVLGDCL
jgi:hypothetical protein